MNGFYISIEFVKKLMAEPLWSNGMGMNLLDEKITKVFDFFVSSLLPMSVYLFYMFNEKIGAKFLALGELN